MVTANPELSNIFLHWGQGIEKNRESGRVNRRFEGRSLEKPGD
jgi:hypothetical protein